MGKNMKLPFLSRASSDSKLSSWPWPSCNLHPKTLSFRSPDDLLKTMNPAYLDSSIEPPESSSFTDSPSFSAESEPLPDSVETVIRGLRSDRLFFEPGGESSSILEEAAATKSSSSTTESRNESSAESAGFKDSTLVVPMDSQDPYLDFRKSMEEMVEAHGLKDWKGLEELLFWYLKVNDKSNHEYIVAAFLDFLVGLSFSDKSCHHRHHPPLNLVSSSSCSSSPLSFYTSSSSMSSSSLTPCVSSSLEVEEDEDDEEDGDLSSRLQVERKIIEVVKVEEEEEDDDDDSSL